MEQDKYIAELEKALFDLIRGFGASDIEAHFGNVQNLSFERCEEIRTTLEKVYKRMEGDEEFPLVY